MEVGEPEIPKNQAKSEKPKERFSYRTATKTINEAFLEFLNEQKKDLSPKTYNDYDQYFTKNLHSSFSHHSFTLDTPLLA